MTRFHCLVHLTAAQPVAFLHERFCQRHFSLLTERSKVSEIGRSKTKPSIHKNDQLPVFLLSYFISGEAWLHVRGPPAIQLFLFRPVKNSSTYYEVFRTLMNFIIWFPPFIACFGSRRRKEKCFLISLNLSFLHPDNFINFHIFKIRNSRRKTEESM